METVKWRGRMRLIPVLACFAAVSTLLPAVISSGPAHAAVSAPSADSARPASRFLLTNIDATNPAIRLDGTVFDILGSDGATVGTMTTGADGTATSPELPLGTYRLTETVAPAGYLLDPTVHFVTLNGHTPRLVIPGVPALTAVGQFVVRKTAAVGHFVLTKTDAADPSITLPGAVFAVLDSSGADMGTMTTGTDGTATSPNLPFGTYTLVEIAAPAGYQLDPVPHTVTVDSETRPPLVVAPDTQVSIPTGRITLTKTDADDTSIRLPGAVYELRDSSGNVVATMTTGANGTATSPELPLGTYTLVEITAPPGYLLNPVPILVTVASGGSITMVTIPDDADDIIPPGLVRSPLPQAGAADPPAPLVGAVFDVADGSGAIVATISTGPDGTATSPRLPAGAYRVTEIAAPPGYLLSKTPHDVSVASGTTPAVVVLDPPAPTPVISTSINSPAPAVGRALSDTVTVSGAGGTTVPGSWTLFGPVAAVSGGCANADWRRAPRFESGNFTVGSDGRATITTHDPFMQPGCYSFAVSLDNTATTRAAAAGPGLTSETALVAGLPIVPVTG